MEKGQQHMIPRRYLAAWAYPNPPAGKKGTIWVIQKRDIRNPELKSPKKYFREKDRYTLSWLGGRDLAVENSLGMVEAWFGEAFANVQAHNPLTGHDRVKIAFFTAAMMLRTNHIPSILADVLGTNHWQSASLEKEEGLDSSSSDALKAKLPDVTGDTVGNGLIMTAGMLVRMKLSIFVTDDEAGFVTGDEPCYVCVPGAWNSYPGHPDVELTIPLSPRHMAFYSWKLAPMLYAPWDRETVDRVNSRTIAGCKTEFVSWKGTTRPEWFIADFPSARPDASTPMTASR
jgi:hypothetical protein